MMSRRTYQSLAVALGLVAFVVWMMTGAAAQSGKSNPAWPTTANGEWWANGADNANTRYVPLSEIDASNFSKMELAWTFKTENLGPGPEYKLEGTPLVVNGVMYTTGGQRKAVVALDPEYGELLWVHSIRDEGARGDASPRPLSGRGVSYWTDGNGDERIYYTTIGYRLVALNAKTGQMIQSFGQNGIVDLKKWAVYGKDQPIDLVEGEIGLHNPPAVTKSGVLILGSSFRHGCCAKKMNNTKGMVLAFDAKTGKFLWKFNTIPRPGEFGNDTWLNDSWQHTGNTGVWNQISVDEELGLAYLPVEEATNDFYGGHRPGNNLFANSLVAVDVKTGVRKWHFQLIHHSMWDQDIAAPPILGDITVNGRNIKAVMVISKTSLLYTFDRATGQPVWPIEEKPAPKGDTPGEWYSPTQPIPSRPPALDFNSVTEDGLIDFTPELRKEAVEILSHYRMGPVFTPPAVSKVEGPYAGFRSSGGVNWGGFAFDPETHVAFIPTYNGMQAIGLVHPKNPEESDMDYIQGDAREKAPRLAVQGLPFMKPPYGRISAVNMDKGDIIWQVPNGETPDAVRNSPALKGLDIPRTGMGGTVGALVTKTLVISAESQFTTTKDHPRGAMMRAYDKATGKEVGAVLMPAPQTGKPMSYQFKGHQYIVIAVGGAGVPGEYLTFALPGTKKPVAARTSE